MSQYKVTIVAVDCRLDKFLLSKLKNISRSQIQKDIKSGLYNVNGKKVAAHYFLKKGDIIAKSDEGRVMRRKNVSLREISRREITPTFSARGGSALGGRSDRKTEIISETHDYLIINKPVGLLVHPTISSQEFTLVDWLVKKYPLIKNVFDHENKSGVLRPGIVHRLDRDVSGLMVIAKTQKMFDNLKNQFKQRVIKKEYLTLVYGSVNLDNGRIERAIARSKRTGLMAAHTNETYGKEAITEFEVVKRFKNYTLLKIKLLTGRTHQIRVHLKSIGHSIVGDKLYLTRNVRLKKGKLTVENIFLYSCYLGFFDLENNWQEFKLKEPKWWIEFLKSLKS